ncbi:hypothetical protein DB30_07779 [Enhygromyxa salina]|uniref:Uncharacterized protein n=1 Tax=Enhygromyxa salina TaxID=215803 RepID=A0A0C1ZMV3_9BACT|nr:hypothetical protein DB30_07779 [Enhygromyxa salina]
MGESGGSDESTTGTSETTTHSSSAGTSTETETETTQDPTQNPTTLLFVDDGFDEGEWTNQCDPFAQDCPEGEKCVAYASTGDWWDDNKCVPVLGSQAAGEPCSYDGPVDATDDCDQDSACWNVEEVDGEWTGVCHWFCGGTPDTPMCPEGTTCPITSDGTFALCVWTCDPVLQDCDDGLGCYWANTEFTCVPTTQDIPAGEPCGFVNDCERGLLCAPAEALPACEGSSCCTPYCDLMLGDAQCDAVPGTSCVPFYEEGRAPASYAHVGVCLIP